MSSRKPDRVERGGCVFSIPIVEYSKETEDLLKRLIAESHLTMLQRQRVLGCVALGTPLPLPLSAPSSGNRPRTTSAPRCVTASVTSCTHRRSLHDIVQSGAYRPPPIPRLFTVDRTKEIQKFQCLMAHGKEAPSPVQSKGKKDAEIPIQTPRDLDRFQELVADIEDNFKFLAEMRGLGKEKHYWPIVRQQVAAKLRQMEKIDKQKSKELQEWLKSHDQNNNGRQERINK